MAQRPFTPYRPFFFDHAEDGPARPREEAPPMPQQATPQGLSSSNVHSTLELFTTAVLLAQMSRTGQGTVKTVPEIDDGTTPAEAIFFNDQLTPAIVHLRPILYPDNLGGVCGLVVAGVATAAQAVNTANYFIPHGGTEMFTVMPGERLWVGSANHDATAAASPPLVCVTVSELGALVDHLRRILETGAFR